MLARRGIERGYDEWLPTEWALGEGDVVAVYGVRVLVPIARALRIPLLGRLLAAGEWWARDSFLRGFGAHLLVVLRKDEDAERRPPASA